MTKLNVISIKPPTNDIPASLRALADGIEKDEFGYVKNLAWVLDGDTILANGILGTSPDPDQTAYYLFGLAQREIEDAALE